MKRLESGPSTRFSAIPFYLVLVPIASLVAQQALAGDSRSGVSTRVNRGYR